MWIALYAWKMLLKYHVIVLINKQMGSYMIMFFIIAIWSCTQQGYNNRKMNNIDSIKHNHTQPLEIKI